MTQAGDGVGGEGLGGGFAWCQEGERFAAGGLGAELGDECRLGVAEGGRTPGCAGEADEGQGVLLGNGAVT